MADVKVMDLQKISPKLTDHVFMIGEDSEYQGKVEELVPLLISQSTAVEIFGRNQSVVSALNELEYVVDKMVRLIDSLEENIEVSDNTYNIWKDILGLE